jgi:amyloid beta precursor protein binding protein 1
MPPISGTLPDLNSSTELFIQLQNVYMQKALEDRAVFKSLLTGLAERSGCRVVVGDERIDLFCRNARNVCCIDTRSIEDEFSADSMSVADACRDPFSDSCQVYMICLLTGLLFEIL